MYCPDPLKSTETPLDRLNVCARVSLGCFGWGPLRNSVVVVLPIEGMHMLVHGAG